MTRRVVLLVAAFVAWWASATAQVIDPPNRFHPYRGGTNCIQVVDSQGNFNCSSLVTINPTTGAFSALGTSSVMSPVFGALVIAPSGNTLQSLGNDLVLTTSGSTIAPAGPGATGAVLRIRRSPLIPGYCRAVMAFGNSFGQEYVIAFQNPAYAFLGRVGLGSGVLAPDFYVVDVPGGPAGC